MWNLVSVSEQDAARGRSARAGVLGLVLTACGHYWDRDVPELAPGDEGHVEKSH